MTRQSYYKAQKTYNVASLVTSHGHPVAAPANVEHGNAGNEPHVMLNLVIFREK
jgi:hypothetical protein